MKPGPKGNPARALRDAALDYALDVEFDGDGWDKLRKAAIRYAESEKHKGRPRNEDPIQVENVSDLQGIR